MKMNNYLILLLILFIVLLFLVYYYKYLRKQQFESFEDEPEPEISISLEFYRGIAKNLREFKATYCLENKAYNAKVVSTSANVGIISFKNNDDCNGHNTTFRLIAFEDKLKNYLGQTINVEIIYNVKKDSKTKIIKIKVPNPLPEDPNL